MPIVLSIYCWLCIGLGCLYTLKADRIIDIIIAEDNKKESTNPKVAYILNESDLILLVVTLYVIITSPIRFIIALFTQKVN